jgi:hypothetical protein
MWCKACRHQAEADLQALVDAGKGDVPLKDLRFGAAGAAAISPRRDGEGDAADGALIRRTSSRNSASAASPRRRYSSGVMSGADAEPSRLPPRSDDDRLAVRVGIFASSEVLARVVNDLT